MVMPDTDLQMGCSVAERVRSQLESSTVDSVDKGPISVTVSIGVAQLTDGIDGATALVDQAAKALTDAKESGKNRRRATPTSGNRWANRPERIVARSVVDDRHVAAVARSSGPPPAPRAGTRPRAGNRYNSAPKDGSTWSAGRYGHGSPGSRGKEEGGRMKDDKTERWRTWRPR